MAQKTAFNWLGVIQIGLIAGLLAVFVSLQGMVQAFHDVDIIAGIISTGQMLLLLAALVAGYLAAGRTGGDSPLFKLAGGALSGLITGGLVAALVLIGPAINLRSILVNASPALYKILTFDQETGAAVLSLLAIGTVIGAAGGALRSLPARLRRAVVVGLVAMTLLGILQDQIRLILVNSPISREIGKATSWMFGTQGQRGLSLVGAIVVFVIVSLANYFLAGGAGRQRTRQLPPARQRALRWGSLALVLLLLILLPNILGNFLNDVANTVGIFILMGLGLNIVVGFAGLLDLGYVAFFAIGAYTMGVLTTSGGELSTSYGLTFWQALPIAVGISILAGIILGVPVLHIRGDYLAIVTLGFGEIIRILALSDFLKPHIGGSQGIVLVARPQVGDVVFDDPQTLYYLILAGCLLVAFIARRLKDSRVGRTWMALREDEDVAQAMGIDLVKTKLMAFAVGAAFSGLAGAIFASKLGTIYPHSFSLIVSINVLALIIIGGMGSIPGVIVGALVLVGLPGILREFDEFSLLIFGAVLVAMMLLRPQGLLPEKTRARELLEEREAETEIEPGAQPAAAGK